LLRISWHGDKDISAGDGLASIGKIKAARKKNASVLREQLQKRPLNLNFLLCSRTLTLVMGGKGRYHEQTAGNK